MFQSIFQPGPNYHSHSPPGIKWMWMKSSRVVRASDSQCRSRNCPGFDPSILRHSGIWGAADEAVLNIVRKKPPPPKKKNLTTNILFKWTYFNQSFNPAPIIILNPLWWSECGCGWDLAEWLKRLTANGVVETVLGSIPASSDTVESERWRMKQCWICNRWSCKLYLEVKVQREHFYKNIALRIPPSLLARPLFRTKNRFAKAGKFSRFFICRFKNGGWLRWT